MAVIKCRFKHNFNELTITLTFFDIWNLQRRNLVDKGPMMYISLCIINYFVESSWFGTITVFPLGLRK